VGTHSTYPAMPSDHTGHCLGAAHGWGGGGGPGTTVTIIRSLHHPAADEHHAPTAFFGSQAYTPSQLSSFPKPGWSPPTHAECLGRSPTLGLDRYQKPVAMAQIGRPKMRPKNPIGPRHVTTPTRTDHQPSRFGAAQRLG